MNLELPLSRTKLTNPDLMRRYGFIVDPATPANPDQLPVGFTRHYDERLDERVLAITCAACHTGELHVTRGGQINAYRVDGGQANHAFTDMQFGNFLPTLVASMVSTVVNPIKFNRFAREELIPGIDFVPTYGNTLMGLACSRPITPDDGYTIAYYAPQPRAVSCSCSWHLYSGSPEPNRPG